jgi:hypothetical protein
MKTEMKQVIGALVLFAAIVAMTAAKDDLAKGLRRGGWFSPASHRLWTIEMKGTSGMPVSFIEKNPAFRPAGFWTLPSPNNRVDSPRHLCHTLHRHARP